MAVFSLTSDDQFISAASVEAVEEYSDIIAVKCPYVEGGSTVAWTFQGYIGPSHFSKFQALEVFGVTIKGDKFKELLKDLKFNGAKNVTLSVNRLGQCYVYGIEHPSFAKPVIRLNDLFGWSKYGVNLPDGAVNHVNVWDKRDTYKDCVVVDVPAGMRAVEEEKVLRQSLEEKEKESSVGKKELEYTKRVVEKNEVLRKALLKAKEKELELVKNQILSYKDVLIKTLIDDQNAEELIKRLDNGYRSVV
ncbi:hypothetical protein LINGRAHAP2_LOCUS35166 [Linum grandiflorum]